MNPNIPTATWTPIAPTVEVWHNHGHPMPLDRIGDGPGTVRIRLVCRCHPRDDDSGHCLPLDPTRDRNGAAG